MQTRLCLWPFFIHRVTAPLVARPLFITTMHSATDPAASVPPSDEGVGNRWSYLLLLAVQTVGVLLLYWNALPWYRQLLADPTSYAPVAETRVWALSAIALIQVGYWTRYRIRPPLPRLSNVVLGHIVMFLARLSFLLVSTVFSFVFFTQKLGSQMPLGRYALMVAGLFSLFCYMEELRRLGQRLCEPAEGPDAGAR